MLKTLILIVASIIIGVSSQTTTTSQPITTTPKCQHSGPTLEPETLVPTDDPELSVSTSNSQHSGPTHKPETSVPTDDPELSVSTPNSQHSGPTLEPETLVPTDNPEFSGSIPNPQNSTCSTLQWAGPSIQFLSRGETHNADGLFFDKRAKILYFCDRFTSKCHSINLKNGVKKHHDVNITEGEQVAFAYPQLNPQLDDSTGTTSSDGKNVMKPYVVGIGNEIVPVTYDSNTNTSLNSQPTPITGDKGYIICKAHADKNGFLFLTMNSQSDKMHRHGRLYKIELNKPTLVKQFDCDVNDFVWSHDYETMYIITDHGKCIKKYSYDAIKREISNEQKVFKMPQTANPGDAMTGIEIDKDNYLWVTVEHCGNVMQIDSRTGDVKQAIQMPITMLTGLTFGDKGGLFISTSKKCNLLENGAGSILHLSGIKDTGEADNEVLL